LKRRVTFDLKALTVVKCAVEGSTLYPVIIAGKNVRLVGR